MASVTVALNSSDNQISRKNYSYHSERISEGKFKKKKPKFVLDETFIRTDFVLRFLVFSVST